jgi:hypothetical protein
MGLVLAEKLVGPEVAQMIQLGIEYDPQPPFDSGAPSKAPAELYALLKEMMTASEEAILAEA